MGPANLHLLGRDRPDARLKIYFIPLRVTQFTGANKNMCRYLQRLLGDAKPLNRSK